VDAYEYVVVWVSIVLGLAVTQLLSGVGELYRTHKRVRTYWLHTAYAITVLVFTLLLAWMYWNYRAVPEWSFFGFLLYLSPAIALYFLAVITTPAAGSEAAGDLRAYYYANRTGFFGAFAAALFLASSNAYLLRGVPLLDPSMGLRLVALLLLLAAMRSSSERAHTVIFALVTAVLIVFSAGYALRLSS
jgi:hypothetical protein